MKILEVDFSLRVKLVGVLGQATGTVAKINALGRIYDQLRFTDEELAQITTTDMGGGVTRFDGPPGEPEWGTKSIEMADAETGIVVDELGTWRNCQMADREWINPLVEKLTKLPSRKRSKRAA